MKRIYNLFTSDKTWIFIAISLAVLGILCILTLFVSLIFYSQYEDLLKDLVIWAFGASAFSFGFCVTLRHSNSLELQTKAKERELKIKEKQLREDYERHHFDRLKMLIKCLDGNTIASLDAISELYKEAIYADKRGEQEFVQRIVLIFEFFVKRHSNINNKPISYFDDNWLGKNTHREPAIAIQTIIRMLYNRSKDNPFKKIEHIDLTHCNLQNIDFTGLAVANTDFGNSALHSARMYSSLNDKTNNIITEFTDCKFWHTYLQGANMSNAYFVRCDFTHSDMTWANMCESNFTKCTFTNTDMTACLISKAKFENNVFNSTIMIASDIYGVDKNTPVISTKNTYKEINLDCAFVYPTGSVIDDHTEVIKSIQGCEHDESRFNNPENRLSRLKRYSMGEYGFLKNIDSKYIFKDKEERDVKLISIYRKILKYAHEDESGNLRCNLFHKLWNDLYEILKSLENNHHSS